MGTFFCSKKKRKRKKEEQLSFIKDVADFAMCLLPTTIQCEVQDQNTIDLTRNVPQISFFFWLSGPQPIAYSFIFDNDSGLKRQTGWELRLLGPLRVTGI